MDESEALQFDRLTHALGEETDSHASCALDWLARIRGFEEPRFTVLPAS